MKDNNTGGSPGWITNNNYVVIRYPSREKAAASSPATLPSSDVFVLKQESSIFKSFIRPCMQFIHDGTGQTLCCLADEGLAWHFQNHTQGRMNDLNMQLLCFRTKTSGLRGTLL